MYVYMYIMMIINIISVMTFIIISSSGGVCYMLLQDLL